VMKGDTFLLILLSLSLCRIRSQLRRDGLGAWKGVKSLPLPLVCYRSLLRFVSYDYHNPIERKGTTLAKAFCDICIESNAIAKCEICARGNIVCDHSLSFSRNLLLFYRTLFLFLLFSVLSFSNHQIR